MYISETYPQGVFVSDIGKKWFGVTPEGVARTRTQATDTRALSHPSLVGLFLMLHSRLLGPVIWKHDQSRLARSRQRNKKEKDVQRDDLTFAFTLIISPPHASEAALLIPSTWLRAC